jgi:hypothetical protein
LLLLPPPLTWSMVPHNMRTRTQVHLQVWALGRSCRHQKPSNLSGSTESESSCDLAPAVWPALIRRGRLTRWGNCSRSKLTRIPSRSKSHDSTFRFRRHVNKTCTQFR